MMLYEVVIATGIAVVLVVSAIGGLIARLMIAPDPEEDVTPDTGASVGLQRQFAPTRAALSD